MTPREREEVFGLILQRGGWGYSTEPSGEYVVLIRCRKMQSYTIRPTRRYSRKNPLYTLFRYWPTRPGIELVLGKHTSRKIRDALQALPRRPMGRRKPCRRKQ